MIEWNHLIESVMLMEAGGSCGAGSWPCARQWWYTTRGRGSSCIWRTPCRPTPSTSATTRSYSLRSRCARTATTCKSSTWFCFLQKWTRLLCRRYRTDPNSERQRRWVTGHRSVQARWVYWRWVHHQSCHQSIRGWLTIHPADRWLFPPPPQKRNNWQELDYFQWLKGGRCDAPERDEGEADLQRALCIGVVCQRHRRHVPAGRRLRRPDAVDAGGARSLQRNCTRKLAIFPFKTNKQTNKLQNKLQIWLNESANLIEWCLSILFNWVAFASS